MLATLDTYRRLAKIDTAAKNTPYTSFDRALIIYQVVASTCSRRRQAGTYDRRPDHCMLATN